MPPTRYSPGFRKYVVCLPEVATTKLHAAYAAFTPGLSCHWSSRSPILSLRIPLEKVIHQILISAFRGYTTSSELEGELFSLPVRFVGIGLANQATNSPHTLYFQNVKLTLLCGTDFHTRNRPSHRCGRGLTTQNKTRWNSQNKVPLKYIIALLLQQRKVSHHGWLFSFEMIMNSTITKRNSVILEAWVMNGASQTPLRHVIVQQYWQYVMPWSATWEASTHNTARYETSQHLLSQKSATMLSPSHTCSH